MPLGQLTMGERLESYWGDVDVSDWTNVDIYDAPKDLIHFPTDKEVNEKYWMTMGKQATHDPRRFGSIQVPPHIPLTITNLYYYINYETLRQPNPPSPEEKWVALTVAFIRHSPDHKPCFGDMVVERGKRVGACGACMVGDWCGELKAHLVANPNSKRFFPKVSSIKSKDLRTSQK